MSVATEAPGIPIATKGYTRACQVQELPELTRSSATTSVHKSWGRSLYLWGTSGANDHVVIAVKLEGARIQQKVVRAGRPIGINLCTKAREHNTQAEREKLQTEANDSFRRIWAAAQNEFGGAIARRDANETHRIWCRVCKLWLYFNQGEEHDEPDEKLATRRNLPRRGQPMPFLEQDLVRDTIGEADQKHMGVSYNANGALLRLREGSAWMHAHCGKNTDAPTRFNELSSQDRTNLNRV